MTLRATLAKDLTTVVVEEMTTTLRQRRDAEVHAKVSILHRFIKTQDMLTGVRDGWVHDACSLLSTVAQSMSDMRT